MSTNNPRRRSSQYSLFPNCSPMPLSRAASIGSRGHSRKRHSEGCVRDLAYLSPRRRATTNEATDLPIVAAEQTAESDAMGGLIPFKLEATTSHTMTLSSPSPLQKSLPQLPGRRASQSSRPATPVPVTSRPDRKARPGSVSDLIILPYTQEEWTVVMEEVRGLYSKGQYKHCATRCKQILEGIKDPFQVHPLYSIYLSFFAASSLEMSAASQHSLSSSKLPLYQESLSFYQKAETFVEYASFSTDPNIAYASRQILGLHSHASHASISSSIRSSISSVFSQASASSLHSAGSSVCDSPIEEEDGALKRSASCSSSSESEGPRRRLKNRSKKVSFSLQLPTLISQTPLAPATPASTLLDAFPAPPSEANSSPSRSPTRRRSSILSPSPATLNRSMTRYRSHLEALKTQMAYHISSIEGQIATLALAKKARRSNLPNQFVQMEGVDGEEVKRVELRERIRRLKEGGWERKRFDGGRYRVLCERALEEVCDRI